uniref:NADP-dependent oxidoreductase domain-containing protein n=1 Tax=Acrobeloides nanus TaxID=290746 RepID=A0A914DSN7_9BILA
MAPKIPTVKMSNGLDFPLFGLGTWQSKDEAELKGALEAAIDAGYRYIDTATLYQNEHIIGEFLEEKFNSGKLKRSDIFITSKVDLFKN